MPYPHAGASYATIAPGPSGHGGRWTVFDWRGIYMVTVIGCALLVVAAGWIAYKMYVSYSSFGGTVEVIVYDAAIYPPILTGVGLYLVLPGFGIAWSAWMYVAIALVLIPIVVGGIKLMEKIGDREL